MTAEEKNNKIITFGCRLNAFESEAIKNAVAESGEKNLIIFNSCAVTAQAEKDLRASIRKMHKENPQAKIVVTGCAAQIDPQKYAKMPEIDLVLGNVEKSSSASYKSDFKITKNSAKNINENPEILHKDNIFDVQQKAKNNFITADEHSKIKVNDIMSVRDTAPQLVSYFENQTRAFLEIQNGCNHRCTFCIIPYGRGNSRSVPLGEIVKQSQKMVEAGHKEIVLT
jgi:threonylcarbamoyladenosine tRNA methylthiotransferase MtaB